jgi:dihydropteroate synthase
LTEPATTWSVAGEVLDISSGLLVGILNVTPDSFSDGGQYSEPAAAIAHGVELAGQGAALVDVGAESTRPGARPVPESEELRRLMPVVEGLASEGIQISVDTYKPGVADKALDAGAVVVNDVNGFRDDDMIEVVAAADCGVVLTHMQGTPVDMHVDPRYEDVVSEVENFLVAGADRLQRAGVSRYRIAIDPGMGFGKRARHSLALLANLDRLTGHDMPVMIGASRKGFLSSAIGHEGLGERDLATAVTTALSFAAGARLFRVHDVAKSRTALAVSAAIVANQWSVS